MPHNVIYLKTLVALLYGPKENEGYVFARNRFNTIGTICGDHWNLEAVRKIFVESYCFVIVLLKPNYCYLKYGKNSNNI